MKNILEYLKGKRTYIAAGLGVILTGLYTMGYIDQASYESAAAFLGFLGLGFLRYGINSK